MQGADQAWGSDLCFNASNHALGLLPQGQDWHFPFHSPQNIGGVCSPGLSLILLGSPTQLSIEACVWWQHREGSGRRCGGFWGWLTGAHGGGGRPRGGFSEEGVSGTHRSGLGPRAQQGAAPPPRPRSCRPGSEAGADPVGTLDPERSVNRGVPPTPGADLGQPRDRRAGRG